MLGVPDAIINKPPSADLWSGQTDENEIGVTYNLIDNLLKKLIDENETSMQKLESEGFNIADISRIVSMLNRNAFKRKPPEIAPLDRTDIPDNIQLEQ